MIALQSRTDAFDVATAGSGALLMSLAKDTGENFRPGAPQAGVEAKGDDAKICNPRCAVLQDFYQKRLDPKRAVFEVSQAVSTALIAT